MRTWAMSVPLGVQGAARARAAAIPPIAPRAHGVRAATAAGRGEVVVVAAAVDRELDGMGK